VGEKPLREPAVGLELSVTAGDSQGRYCGHIVLSCAAAIALSAPAAGGATLSATVFATDTGPGKVVVANDDGSGARVDLVLACSGINANTTSTAAAPSTEIDDFGDANYFEWASSVYRIDTTAGSKTVGGTSVRTTNATSNLTICAAYKAG
jgi:hypothetical protein